jgi:hypothetical protein
MVKIITIKNYLNKSTIIQKNKHYYKIISNKFYRISKKEFEEINDIAYILCELKYSNIETYIEIL